MSQRLGVASVLLFLGAASCTSPTYTTASAPARTPAYYAAPAPSSAPRTGTPTTGAVRRDVVATVPPPSTSATPRPPPAAPPPAPTASPVVTAPATFGWVGTLGQAQSSARGSGRLIFIEAGRDACGNCQALRQRVIPDPVVQRELGAVSVGYYDDVDRSPQSRAFQILTQNMPEAVDLPLVGWVTPDLRWVHGFSGRRDMASFRGEIAAARATYFRMAEANRPAADRALAGVPPAKSLPDAELTDIGDPDGGPAKAARPASSPPPASPPLPPMTAPRVGEPPSPPPPSTGSGASGSTPSATGASTPARDAMKRAAAALSSNDVTSARSLILQAKASAADTAEAREAQKGDVAVWNWERIRSVGPEEAARLRAQAGKDLKGTVWEPLFR
jgi:hypothetical protein